MKTRRHVGVLWSLFTIVLLCFKADTYETPITRRGRPSLKEAPPPRSKLRGPSVIYSPSEPAAETGSPAASPSRTSYPFSSSRPTDIQSDSSAVQPDVSVTCSTADFVVRVKPGFYGLDADAEELTLGSGCRSSGVLRPYGDILFNYPLTACGARREAPSDYLVYKHTLHYRPSPKHFPTRSQRLDVHIECRYPRTHHVHQLVLKPTWKTAIMRKKLKGRPSDFRIELMNDSWSSTAKSSVYQLGQNIHFQVSASYLPPGGKLYVSSCYASPSNSSENSLNYTIIDNFGCLVDSKREPSASQFVYRTKKTVRFSLKAFQFTLDPETEISVHCHLSVTSDGPSPTHKSCTYRGNRWTALSGDHSLCDCCDSKCVTSKTRRSMMEAASDAFVQGFASSQLLSISDQTEEDGFLPVSSSTVFISTEDGRTGRGDMDRRDFEEYLWRSVDVLRYDDKDEESFSEEEEGELEEDTTAPDTKTSFFRKGVSVESRNTLEEEGSGDEGEGDVTLGEEIYERSKENQAKAEGQIPQTVKPPPPPESEEQKAGNVGEDRNRTRTLRLALEKDEGLEGVAHDEKSTWYFSWR